MDILILINFQICVLIKKKMVTFKKSQNLSLISSDTFALPKTKWLCRHLHIQLEHAYDDMTLICFLLIFILNY